MYIHTSKDGFFIVVFYAPRRVLGVSHRPHTHIPYETGSRRAPWPRSLIPPLDSTTRPKPQVKAAFPHPLGRKQIWLRRKLVTTNLGSYTEFSAAAPYDR